jgi:hypothetical protein
MAANWEPTFWVILAYLLLVGLVILGGYIWHRDDGEVRKRLNLMWMAAQGKDYRIPDFDPGMVTYQEHPAPGQADDPITAILVRSSEAERRWYALNHLLDRWESKGKHQRMMQPREEQAIHEFLRDQHRQAIEEAKEAIRSRIEMRQFSDEEGMAERFIIEDPATDYKVQVQMSHRDLIRYEPKPGGELPPPVQQRMESFPDQLLREVEQRSDTQHCWV